MAQIRLDRDEVRYEELPPVCMKCGEPAGIYLRKPFSWHPPWIGLLIVFFLWPYVIVALILTRRMTVYAPLCDAHRNHWRTRNLLTILGLLGVLAVFFTGIIAASSGLVDRSDSDTVLALSVGGGLLLFVAWLLVAILLQSSAIRATEVTDHTITLTGVSPYFVEAVEHMDEEEDDYADDWRRPAPRPRREDPGPRRRLSGPRSPYRD
jgi:hypothetical protein